MSLYFSQFEELVELIVIALICFEIDILIELLFT